MLLIMANADIEVPGGLLAVHAAVSAVAGGLARAHGQRQFYSLAQVQAQAVARGMDTAASAWAFAAFVTREDFEAFFAVRESPGGYRALRAAMSPSESRALSEPAASELDGELAADALWWLIRLAREAAEL